MDHGLRCGGSWTVRQLLLFADKLEAQGISVWVDVASIDAGSDFLSKIGEAIIDAKVRRSA